MKARHVVFLVICVSLIVTLRINASAQTAPVFAFQAPDCRKDGAGNVSSNCSNFLQHELPHLSGIGVTVPWTSVDLGTSATGPTYDFVDTIDAFLNAYILSTDFTWNGGCVNNSVCQIMLIILPESDHTGSDAQNAYTPPYVFSTSWANDPRVLSDAPQDVMACSNFPGQGNTNPLPYTGGTPSVGEAVVWNVNSCHVINGSGDVNCGCTGANCNKNFSGFPVVYERPIKIAYQLFLKALSDHYNHSINPNDHIGQYISYVRAGMSQGGENSPVCSVVTPTNPKPGGLLLPDWSRSLSVPVGYAITPTNSTLNPGHYTFVAIKAGVTNSSGSGPSWKQTPGDRTTQDPPGLPSGVIWENVGLRNHDLNAIQAWPGPNGQFGTHQQSQGYSDNGYLSQWGTADTHGNTLGYISEMVTFLGGLGSTFNWDISAHFGPNFDLTYAESEADLVNALGKSKVGFGIQSLNIKDAYPTPGSFPTSLEDWVANFTNYSSVPIRHLQTVDPGMNLYWAGYHIKSFSSDGTTVTAYCDDNCTAYLGLYIQVIGITSSRFDGVWLATCNPGCPPNSLQFPDAISSGTYNDTAVAWSANYWPTTLPFAVSKGANRIEVYECDLDYAFGVATYDHLVLPGDCDYESGLAGDPGPSSPPYSNVLGTVQ